jgi:hypothetical protein
MVGQRIFNEAEGRAWVNSHPGDVVYKMVKRLMQDQAPAKSEVLTATDGLPEFYLVGICEKIEPEWNRRKGTTAQRITPWQMVLNQLRTRQQAIRR